MNKSNYQLCNQCVMDNASDITITFDENGVCNYCKGAYENMNSLYFPNEEGKAKLEALIATLKKEGKGKKYDCIMGISGGLDSSYLAYLGHKWGLRILAVHIDDGFDTEVSKQNIDKLIKATNIHMIVEKPDPKQFNELNRAFMLAGIPNIAMAQDNLIFSSLFKYARKYKLRNFLSGGNFSLESILQQGNTYKVYDLVHIKGINKLFGRTSINKLNLISDYRMFYESWFKIINSPRPLNYINYNRDQALKELADFCDFTYYGSKHLENLYTKFVQCYWFYHKFNVDKRRSHLSSLIISGQMTRPEALAELEKPMYDKEEMDKEIVHICKVMDISAKEFEQIMKNPIHQHTDYPINNFDASLEPGRMVKSLLRKVKHPFSVK